MTIDIDYSSPDAQFTYDVNKSPFFKKDHQNFINILGSKQLNTLDHVSLLDIFLSANNVVEPHYHQNAAELVYCISGAAVVSIVNPYTNKLSNYPISPGQVANVPQGWWHYEVATKDNTHLLAIFNSQTPDVILGSDILKLTPPNIMAHTYCLDEEKWKAVTKPVKPSTYIGPYSECHKRNASSYYQPATYYQNPYVNPYSCYSTYPKLY